VKYWEIIADNPSNAGWSLSYVSAVDCNGRTIWIADAHRDDGKRFVVHADEKLTAFLELESAIRACWQREAPCACLRIETSSHESRLFPYQHLIAASLSRNERGETLRLKFSFHDVEIEGNNLRALLVALQDFAVKWVRVMPERYQRLEAGENTLVSSIRVQEAS
jgi:hypothetical protein